MLYSTSARLAPLYKGVVQRSAIRVRSTCGNAVPGSRGAARSRDRPGLAMQLTWHGVGGPYLGGGAGCRVHLLACAARFAGDWTTHWTGVCVTCLTLTSHRRSSSGQGLPVTVDTDIQEYFGRPSPRRPQEARQGAGAAKSFLCVYAHAYVRVPYTQLQHAHTPCSPHTAHERTSVRGTHPQQTRAPPT